MDLESTRLVLALHLQTVICARPVQVDNIKLEPTQRQRAQHARMQSVNLRNTAVGHAPVLLTTTNATLASDRYVEQANIEMGVAPVLQTATRAKHAHLDNTKTLRTMLHRAPLAATPSAAKVSTELVPARQPLTDLSVFRVKRDYANTASHRMRNASLAPLLPALVQVQLLPQKPQQ